VQGIMHPDGELAVARASSELGIPMVLSTVSSHALEDVAAANGDGTRWFQLYWPNDEEVCASFLSRAKAAGFSALVVTLDTWMLAWRPRDLDHGYLPFLTGNGLATYFSDPVFRSRLAKAPEDDLEAAVLRWLPTFSGTDHTWENLAFIREHWAGPILLKGIQHVDDARRAVDAGMDGIVVSNHGGRQVDGAIGSLDALPGIAEAVGERVEVLFDSGIRTGADVLKAIALGAKAVLVGRPWVYGLALGGYDGVKHVLRSLLADVDLALALSGNASVAGLGPDILQQRR
jgi:lactate 2-monooxygenase